MANNNLSSSSLEDYYYHGESSSVSVPFMWESQPGTPKVKFLRENPNNYLPPLTPPPSYCYSPVLTNRSSPSPKTTPNKANNFLQAIFPARSRNKRYPPSSPSYSPSSSSSLSSSSRSTLYLSVPSSPAVSKTPPSFKSRGRRRNSIIASPRLSVDSRVGRDHDHEDEEYDSPVSTLCFGRGGVNARSRSGCFSSLIKVLLN
ncbi:hypothetical protein TIFTF001_000114 [Ficus carica]|uniref:Uncharacterized protein n=1 Tax=Ficus carica TaxID=3494 RepID=A0AA88CNI1_FICCA|nr:hypothetical protein TIFTF001_000114 [Ficus carica]